MKKLKIRLASLNDDGAIASIDTEDDGEIQICETRTRKDGKGMCKKAAKMLREAAGRFDELAKEKDPFKGAIQDKINGRVNHRRINIRS